MNDLPYKPQDPASIRLLFTRIAKNYDLTNHVISLGLDIVWRKKFARSLQSKCRVADICCGSGAMFPLLNGKILAGLDFTKAMLDVAAVRYPGVPLVQGDAQKMPLAPSTFDAAIIVYSIRNIPNLSAAMTELNRILMPGGFLGILDFGVPKNKFLHRLYLLYFKRVMPFIGSWVARDKASYHYFVNSVLNFPKRDEFVNVMQAAGFVDCAYQEYTGGAAILYTGHKSA